MRKSNQLFITLGGLALFAISAYKAYSNREPDKYSLDWIKNLTDEEWEAEREAVRQKSCDPMYDIDTKSFFKIILDLFDKVKNDRAWVNQKPQGPAYRREHGYNLYKP